MARDQVDLTPIERRDELVAWIAQGIKPKSQFRIGTEHEKFAFTLERHQPVPYEGRRGIRSLLEGMQHLLGWQPIMEDDNVIGLFDVTGGGAIIWGVFTSTNLYAGMLSGTYVGASAEASIAAGLGANVLVGGSNRAVALQPVSVQGQVGLNIAAGVGTLELHLAK